MHAQRWTCYKISVPSGGLVPQTNPNQSVMNMFGVPQYTVNIFPTLRSCSSSSKYLQKNFVQGVVIVFR
jgi:hypothetical protein